MSIERIFLRTAGLVCSDSGLSLVLLLMVECNMVAWNFCKIIKHHGQPHVRFSYDPIGSLIVCTGQSLLNIKLDSHITLSKTFISLGTSTLLIVSRVNNREKSCRAKNSSKVNYCLFHSSYLPS